MRVNMLPKWHILYGYIFSLVLIYFFKFSLLAGLIVFLSSVFIDLDHVLIYFLKTKNLNPQKFYSWSITKKNIWSSLCKEEKKNLKRPHFILHGIEFILLLSILSYFYTFFFWILLGVILHLVQDLFILFYEREHISIKTSQIWLWQRNKNRKEFTI